MECRLNIGSQQIARRVPMVCVCTFFTRVNKSVHTVLTLTAVLAKTYKRQLYTFWNKSTEESEEDM